MSYYNIKISPEGLRNDLVQVNFSGRNVGYYSGLTQVLSGETLTGLTIPILLTQDINDLGYYDPFDGNICQKDVVTNFLISADTLNPYEIFLYNTSEQYQKFIELSEYKVDWGDGTQIQTITNFSPNSISHRYPTQDGSYIINLYQKNPFGTINVTKKVVLPYSIIDPPNPRGTVYFVSNIGSWSATPIGYNFIFDGDAINSITGQSTTAYTQTTYIVSGTSNSKLQDLEQYGSQKYVQGLQVYKNRTPYGKVFNISPNFTGYTILDIDYYDYSDGKTIFFYTGTGFNSENITAEPITKQEVLLNVIDQPQIQTNVYVERGKNSAYEKILRLGEVDNVGDMINYGYGFFNIELKG